MSLGECSHSIFALFVLVLRAGFSLSSSNVVGDSQWEV
jgi:hypothetical protein